MLLVVDGLFPDFTCEANNHIKVIVQSKVSAHDDDFDLLVVFFFSVGLFDNPYFRMEVGQKLRLLRALYFIDTVIHEGQIGLAV